METFAIGDVVVLKSGGPAMTVTDALTNPSDPMLVGCHWFDGATLKQDVFDAPELVKKSASEG